MKEDSHYLKRAGKLSPDVERLTLILLRQGNGFIDTRKIWGILSLDKIYSPEQINKAYQDAIRRQEFSYRTVLALHKLQSQSVPSDPKVHSKTNETKNKFVRPLSEYQEQLSQMK